MATQNGSFLFLNLGSNTPGFSNSFTFSNPKLSTNSNSNPNPNSILNPPVRTLTTFNSTLDKQLETSENPEIKSKKNSKHDSEDPEWVPEKKSRCTSTCTKLKHDLKTTNLATKTMQQTLEPIHVSVPAPPQYLISLLGFLGWKICLKSGTSEYVYQSPNGMSYHSLPKAFKTFLDGNSKYKEKPWLVSSGIGMSSSKIGTDALHGVSQERKPRNNRAVKRNFEKMEGSSENGKCTRSAKQGPPRRTCTALKDGSNKEKEKPKRKLKFKKETLPRVDNLREKQLEISSSKRPGISSLKRNTLNGKNQVDGKPFIEQSERRGKNLSENGDIQYKESCTMLGHCEKRGETIYEAGDVQFKAKYPNKRSNTEFQNGSIQFKDSCQTRSTLKARSRSRSENENKNKKASEPEQKLTVLSKLIDAGVLGESQRVMYVSTESSTGTGTNFLIGTVTRDGILCTCCDEVVSVLEFESHAGSDARNPWENIFLISGQTLVQCLKEAWEKERKFGDKLGDLSAKGKNVGVYDENDESDDMCGICADGGRLICCDGCLSTFHQDCLNLKALPEGSWYCPYCRCQFCKVYGSEEANGSEPVNSLDPLTCKQCKRNYHKICAWRNDNSESNLFCSKSCNKLAHQLSELIGISNHMEGNFSWTLLKIIEDVGDNMKKSLPSILEGNLKLAMGRSILNECFLPLIDQRTGIDVLSQAIFSHRSSYNRLNYEGFHTIVLQKGDEVIAVALLRFHGTKLAEMPFIATKYQRQGMCHKILKGVEQLLISLEVEKLVVPAVPDMVNTWTKSFSFKPLESSLQEEVKSMSLVIFAETTLLQKTLFQGPPNKQGNYNKKASGISSSLMATSNLYSTGFPFFSMQEIFQHSLPSQGQNGNNINLEDSRSFFAQGPDYSRELPEFSNDFYNNISFETLLRM